MLPSLVLGLSLLIPLSHAQPLDPVESFDTYSKYLAEKTNGAVRPIKESYISFRINNSKNEAVPLLPEGNPDLIHSLFETDVHKFILNMGTKDFTSAKKKFYGAQTFNRGTQQYTRPYVYPSDWMSLNHNPIRKLNLPNSVYGEQFVIPDLKTIAQSPMLELDLHQKLDEMTGTEMTSGNKLRLLLDGQNSFQEKIRMVKESKRFFFSVVMVQYCDESSSEIIDAMISKARAGVDVRLMVENVWTKAVLKRCLKRLRDGGVKVELGKGFFNPKTMFTVHHTKFWLRDGEEAIMGGMNMHDFENSSNGFNRHTHDKDVHVVGPAVTDMLREYVRIWNENRKKPDPTLAPYLAIVSRRETQERAEGHRGKELYEDWLSTDVNNINGVCRVLIQGTKRTASPEIIARAYIEIMGRVKYSMLINTPTLRFKEKDFDNKLNSMIIKAILDGSKRGVKVDMISNGVDGGWGEAGHQLRTLAKKLRREGKVTYAIIVEKLDQIVAVFVGRSNRKHLAYMLGPKVDSWQYFNHLHSKQMMFDNILTSTGSFNLDTHSYKNHESTMLCLDKKLADESMAGFISDIVNSVPVL